MILEESFTIDAPRDDVAEFLLAIDQVSACVPGVRDVSEVEPDTYEAVLEVQVGPIRSSFTGTVTIDASESPKRLAASARGRDRQTGSQVQVAFAADLNEQPTGGTEVAARADVTIRGRLGQFGTGVIQSTARAIIRDFADCASSSIAARSADAGGSTDTAAPTSAPPPPRQMRLGRVVARGLAAEIKGLAERVVSGVRRLLERRNGRR